MAQIVTQAVDERLYEAEVTVDGRHYAYRVSVPDDLAERVGADRAAIVRATIAFLLDREPPPRSWRASTARWLRATSPSTRPSSPATSKAPARPGPELAGRTGKSAQISYAILARSWRLEGGIHAGLQGAAEIADPRPVRRLHPAARRLDSGVEPHHADGAARRGRAGGAVGGLADDPPRPAGAGDPGGRARLPAERRGAAGGHGRRPPHLLDGPAGAAGRRLDRGGVLGAGGRA